MKILFISECIYAQPQGSRTVARAHYRALVDIFGSDNVDVVYVKVDGCIDGYDESKDIMVEANFKKAKRIINTISGRPFFLDRAGVNKIIGSFNTCKYDLVWFDNSCYGRIAKEIRAQKENIHIVSFYHDIKLHRELQYYRLEHRKIHFISAFRGLVKNEMLMSKTADVNAFLNQRDADALSVLYGPASSRLLPVTFVDSADFSFIPCASTDINMLFIGCYSWPNIQGLDWFVQNVLPRLGNGYKLFVIGLGMEKLRDQPQYSNNSAIEIIGSVENLSEWYALADIVLGPIFVGDGMKTKTAEALMYGKAFIGTNEALEGYKKEFFISANTAEEFIAAIESYPKSSPRVKGDLRDAYEKFYSEKAACQYVKDIVSAAMGYDKDSETFE